MVLLTKKRSDLHSKRQVFAVLFYFDELLLINFPFYRLCFFKSSLKTLPSPRFWIFWSMCFLKKICNFASYICLTFVLHLCSPLCSIHLFVYLFTNITLSCKKYLHHLFLWAILPSLNLIIPYFPPWHFQSHLSFV